MSTPSQMQIILTVFLIGSILLANASPQPAVQKNGIGFPVIKHSVRSLVKADGSVDSDAIDSHVDFVAARIHNGFKNFEKHTGTKHPSSVTGIEKRDTDFPVGEALESWYTAVAVGGNSLNFELDTASSDLFVTSTDCDSSCNGHTLWNPSSSGTATAQGYFRASYGNYLKAHGVLYTETVGMGSYSVSQQYIGAVTGYSVGFQVAKFPADGLMGLGYQPITEINELSFFQSLVSASALPDNSFSFKFEPTSGQFYLGGADPTLYTGAFSYVTTNIATSGFWEVTMDNLQANGQVILQNLDCIFDTRNSLIIGPIKSVTALANALNGQVVNTPHGSIHIGFPCNNFPTIAFTFGGTSFALSASTLNIGALPYTSDCVASIIGRDTGFGGWTIGIPFLQNVYSTFDAGNSRVGFAQLA